MLLRERVEGPQALPVLVEPATRPRHALLRRPCLEAALESLRLRPRRRVGDLREQRPGLRVELLRQRVEHIHEAMIPAPLLAHRREDRPHCAPDTQVPVGDKQPGRPQPPGFEVAEQCHPALRRLAIPALHREDHLPPVAESGDHDEHGGFILLQPGLDVDPVRPHVDRLHVVQPPVLPRLVLRLPARLQPRNRRGRQRRGRAQQSAQGQIEVAVGQPVQVQLRQESAHFFGPPLEQRQQSALEPRLQPTDARPADRDRARHRAQPARLAVPVPIPRRGVHPVPTLVSAPAQDLLHFFLQELLQQPLHALPGERLQALPHRP